MLKKIPCSTQLCSCRKHGLRCAASCKHCCGKVYDNVEVVANDPADNSIDSESDDECDIQIIVDDLELMAGVELYEEIIYPGMDIDT